MRARARPISARYFTDHEHSLAQPSIGKCSQNYVKMPTPGGNSRDLRPHMRARFCREARHRSRGATAPKSAQASPGTTDVGGLGGACSKPYVGLIELDRSSELYAE